jgi:hypothetical protein
VHKNEDISRMNANKKLGRAPSLVTGGPGHIKLAVMLTQSTSILTHRPRQHFVPALMLNFSAVDQICKKVGHSSWTMAPIERGDGKERTGSPPHHSLAQDFFGSV